jgi:hypothetical protein
MIIHDFVDELGAVDESRDYAPPNVPLARDTQFGLNVTIVAIDVKAQQAILDDVHNKNQGRSLEKSFKKGKRVTLPSKQLALPTISDPITSCKTLKALA